MCASVLCAVSVAMLWGRGAMSKSGSGLSGSALSASLGAWRTADDDAARGEPLPRDPRCYFIRAASVGMGGMAAATRVSRPRVCQHASAATQGGSAGARGLERRRAPPWGGHAFRAESGDISLIYFSHISDATTENSEPASVMCAASHVMSCHAAPGCASRFVFECARSLDTL
jgi:hypothetical protein